MQDLNKSFDAFFEGDDKVAVIKGRWGVGKTYFWNKYIAQRIAAKNLNQVTYIYISLFGKTSLSDVKKSMFYSEPINSDAKIEKASKNQSASLSSLTNLQHCMKKVINKVRSKALSLNLFVKDYQDILAAEKFSNIISGFEYSLIDNYVICFDDLERKADTLTVKEVIGLIDELVTRKNCKVVLIFNENELGENTGKKGENTNKKEFISYREKIVDIELNYEPTCVENMKHVFPDDSEHLAIIENVVNELDIKNIRVLRKIHWIIKKFFVFFDELPNSLKEEFITHAAFLCWGYFICSKTDSIPFETIKSHLEKERSWTSFVYDRQQGKTLKNQKTADEKKCIEITINLKLSPSRFYSHIIHYLEQGFVNEEALHTTVSDILKLAEIEQFNIRHRKAWDIYTNSFENNLKKFIDALKDILNEDIAILEWHDFSQNINVLEEFREDVSGYVKSYVKLNPEKLKKIDPSDPWDMDRIKNEELKDAIYKIHEENKDFNIDDIAEKIALSKGWDDEDVDFLSSRKKSDFYTWMKEPSENLMGKVRGLLKFRSMGSSQSDKEKFKRIDSNIRGALLDIAGENPLNEKRIKNLCGVDLEENDDSNQKQKVGDIQN